MFWITAVKVTAVPNSGENGFPFVDWLRESFGVEFTLPREALGISVFDDK
jgi:hypothetical protein